MCKNAIAKIFFLLFINRRKGFFIILVIILNKTWYKWHGNNTSLRIHIFPTLIINQSWLSFKIEFLRISSFCYISLNLALKVKGSSDNELHYTWYNSKLFFRQSVRAIIFIVRIVYSRERERAEMRAVYFAYEATLIVTTKNKRLKCGQILSVSRFCNSQSAFYHLICKLCRITMSHYIVIDEAHTARQDPCLVIIPCNRSDNTFLTWRGRAITTYRENLT